eukprot:jgi/Galph1/3566/GphlegSOOS_G2197.1
MSEVLALKVGEKRPFEEESEKETTYFPNLVGQHAWKKSRRFWSRDFTIQGKGWEDKNNSVTKSLDIGKLSVTGFRESPVRSESDSDDSVGSNEALTKPPLKRIASRNSGIQKCANCGCTSLCPVESEDTSGTSSQLLQENMENDVTGYIPLKFLKSLKRHGGSSDIENQKIFSWKEMKEIVSEALANKSRHLAYRYNAIIQEKLAEQFQSFSKFNEDYLARQLKERDCSYLS